MCSLYIECGVNIVRPMWNKQIYICTQTEIYNIWSYSAATSVIWNHSWTTDRVREGAITIWRNVWSLESKQHRIRKPRFPLSTVGSSRTLKPGRGRKRHQQVLTVKLDRQRLCFLLQAEQPTNERSESHCVRATGSQSEVTTIVENVRRFGPSGPVGEYHRGELGHWNLTLSDEIRQDTRSILLSHSASRRHEDGGGSTRDGGSP